MDKLGEQEIVIKTTHTVVVYIQINVGKPKWLDSEN